MKNEHERQDLELRLIRQIDKAIIQSNLPEIEKLVETVCDFITDYFLDAIYSSFYVHDASGYVIDYISSSSTFSGIVEISENITDDIIVRGTSLVKINEYDSEANMLCVPLQYPEANIFSVFVFVIRGNADDSEVVSTIKRLTTQIQIAFAAIYERTLTRITFDFWKFSSEKQISFDESFNELAKTIPQFFPIFRSYRLTEQPEVTIASTGDILPAATVTGDLIIRGSSRGFHSNEIILRNESISGLFLDSGESFLLIDPSIPIYRDRYLKYTNTKIDFPQSEFVFLLKHEIVEGTKGVANIEFFEQKLPSSMAGFLPAFANNVSLLYALIESKIRSEMLSFRGDSTTMSEYLGQLSGLFKHEFSAHLSGLSGLLHAAEVTLRFSPPNIEIVKNHIEKVHELIGVQGAEIQYLIDNLYNISVKKEVFLKETIDEAYRSFRASNRAILDEIGFSFSSDHIPKDIRVSASGLLQVYIANLFRNSLNSFQKSPRENPNVTAYYHRRPVKTDKYNIWYDCLEFVDNGAGVNRDTLNQLRQFTVGSHFGSHDGMGFALAGLRRLMQELGGIADLDSEEGSFFKVEIWFRRT